MRYLQHAARSVQGERQHLPVMRGEGHSIGGQFEHRSVRHELVQHEDSAAVLQILRQLPGTASGGPGHDAVGVAQRVGLEDDRCSLRRPEVAELIRHLVLGRCHQRDTAQIGMSGDHLLQEGPAVGMDLTPRFERVGDDDNSHAATIAVAS